MVAAAPESIGLFVVPVGEKLHPLRVALHQAPAVHALRETEDVGDFPWGEGEDGFAMTA